MLQNFKAKCKALINKDREYFPVQTRRFGLLHLTLNHPVKNKFQENISQVCRPISDLQDCRPSQLPTYDSRWSAHERIV